MAVNWQKLQQDFMEIVRLNGGPYKSSCGTITLSFGNVYDNGGISVTFGGYCIGDWGRQEKIGPFETEEQAYGAALQKLEEAKKCLD